MPTVNAWLTPDVISAPRTVCWTLVLPNVHSVLRVVRGALALLEDSANWEQYGTWTPDQAASYMSTVIEGMSQNMCPIGMIAPFLTTSAYIPAGWLECDGTIYNKADYPDLYDRLAHNPPIVTLTPTDFAIDLSGRFPRGVVGAVGDAGGEDTHTLTVTEIPAHTHSYLETPVPPGDLEGALPGIGAIVQLSASTSSTGGDQPHENRPPFFEITWAIYAGVS